MEKPRKNEIRNRMPREIEAFIPVLRETFRLIAIYQFSRTEENEVRLRLQMMRATREMQKFKPYLQKKWQGYFAILENQHRFRIGDVICALDGVIHRIHLRAGNKGLLREGAEYDALGPWSKEVKDFLNERRKTEAQVLSRSEATIPSIWMIISAYAETKESAFN